MKKMILAIGMVMALGLQSASAATEADFKAQQDSLSKAYGKYFGSVLSYMSEQQKNINIDDFFKAFDIVMQADTANQGYMNGLFVGMELTSKMMQNKNQKGVVLNKDLMIQALKDAVNTKGLDQSAVSRVYSDMAVREQNIELMARAFNPKTKAMKKAGEEYVAKLLASGEGYVQTPSGLVYKMVKQGNGKTFGDNEDVRMLYTGKHVDGSVFDSSRDTTVLNSGRVVPGFKEALMLMSPGAEMIAVLPSDIAYGDNGAGRRQNGEFSINPGETLIFTIQTFEPKAKTEEKAVEPAVAKGKSEAKAKTAKAGEMPKPKKKKRK
ncbi:MAG: FKBP-type peptidyl-prolyl cis-trans isomerase [Muribaculaceae bacterium]|nr:FKBP-type peptidyl-prolyl cis-trans isomerase [Muribaculaceae bacterium]